MSLPKVPIKYVPVADPTNTPSTAGGSAVVSTAGPGLCPILPEEGSELYLRGDGSWAGLYFQALTGVPSSFHPSPHAATHVIGPDELPLVGYHNPGLVPPLPSDPTMIFSGSGTWVSSLTIEVPLVSTTGAGIVPAAPGDISYVLVGTGVWERPTGIFPPIPNDASQVLLGTNNWGHLSFSALAGVPATFTPSPHAATHTSGNDILALATAASRGLVPPLPASTALWLRSDNTWASQAATTVTGALGYTPANRAGDTFTGVINAAAAINATAGVVLTNSPLYVGPPTVALGGPTLQYGAIQVYNPTGDSGSPSISIYKLNSTHTSTIRAVQIGVDVNGVEVSTDLAGPINIINSSGQLTPATTTTTGAISSLSAPGSASGQQNSVWLRGDNSWQPLPIATTTIPGGVPPLVTAGSGAGQQTQVWLRGDDTWQQVIPPGVMWDYGGTSAPTGWLLCDGTSYPTATYPALFAVLQYSYGGSGANFNVPDFRGKVSIGTGQGSGLTNRSVGDTGGEETHVLVTAELASHTHGLSSHTHTMAHTHTMGNHTHTMAHTHTMGNHTHLGVDHLHGMDHYHNWGTQGSHIHGLGGHVHSGYYVNIFGGGTWGGGTGITYAGANANTGGPSANADAANTPAGNTVYASQTSGSWVNTGAADRGLTTGGPSTNTSDGASVSTSSGPSTNTSDAASVSTTSGPSTNVSVSTGSDTAHNNLQPYLVATKIIKI